MEALLRAGASPNATDKHRRCPLHVAAARGNVPATHALLAAGAAPGLQDKGGVWDCPSQHVPPLNECRASLRRRMLLA